jgi:hypothetical protein
MSLGGYSPNLDRFDKLMKNKAADYLASDEIFFGAVRLRPMINASLGLDSFKDIDFWQLTTFFALDFIFGSLFAAVFDASDSGGVGVKRDSRMPIMVVTSKKILFAWNSVEISHLFDPIAELNVGTIIEFRRGYTMKIGSSRFRVHLRDVKKLKALVNVTITK